MKKFDDIMSLVKAGFTAEQILTMEETPTTPDPAPVNNPTPATTAHPSGNDGMQDFIKAITDELRDLRQTVTATAIFSSQINPATEKTPADVFGEFLNPNNK